MSIESLNQDNKIPTRYMAWLKQGFFIVKWSLPIILLGMILARLVWMQQRQYPITNRVPALATQMELSSTVANRCAVGPRSEIIYPFESYSVDLGPLLRFAGWTGVGGLAEGYFRQLCSDGTLVPLNLIRMNQWLWVAVVILCTLSLRFVSGSWILPLVAATALMSRGDLMTQIGNISGSVVEMLCCSWWFCCMVHFMRTGSWLTYLVGSLAVIFGAFFNPVLGFLLLAMPFMLLAGKVGNSLLGTVVLENLRKERRRLQRAAARKKSSNSDDYGLAMIVNYGRRVLGLHESEQESLTSQRRPLGRRSRLFSTTDVPFAVWAYQSERWSRIALIGSVLFLTCMLYLAIQMILAYQDVSGLAQTQLGQSALDTLASLSFASFSNNIDFHFLISCVVLVVSAVQSPADGLVCFFESVWLLIFSVITMLIGALTITWFGASISPFSQLPAEHFASVLGDPAKYVIVSMEGLIIAFGIGGIYNLIKAMDSLIFQNRIDQGP